MTNDPQLLVLGQAPIQLANSLKDKIVAEFVNSVDDYIEALQNGNPTVLLYLSPMDGIDVEELTRIAVNQNRGRYKIVFKKSWSNEDLVRFKNEYGVDAFIDVDNLGLLESVIHKGVSRGQEINDRESIFNKLRTQNKELETFNLNLERVIEERTNNALLQKQEVEENVNKVRGVIRLVKELSSQIAIEDTLLLLRNDLKKFHKVNQCMLAVEDYNNNRRLFYYRSGDVVEHKPDCAWPEVQMIRINSMEDQNFLVNQLSFPMGQIISVALATSSSIRATSQPVLYFEHSMSFDEIDKFVDYISFRLQAISITVDRILLQNEVKTASYVWERTFDSISDPVAIINRDFQLLRANQKFFENGKSAYCFESLAGRAEVCPNCPVDRAIRSNVPQGDRVKMGVRSFEVQSYPIVDKANQTVSAVVNHYIDRTESDEMQGQLVQNEKMSAIGHLAGHIAHELNNPLTGIRTLAQILIEENQAEPQAIEDMKEVEKASLRCQQIIKNLLEFSTQELDSKKGSYSFSELVSKTLPFLKTAMGEFERDLKLLNGDDEVFVEPHLMQQVVFNLVNNACQAMGDSGQLVLSEEIVGKKLVFSVKDSGAGIQAKNLELIFEPFFTTKEKGKGTGLGLSMCRKIVESFEGTIRVNSQPGVGSEFIVELPLCSRGDSEKDIDR